MDSDNFELIVEEYEKQRAKNRRDRDERISKVYELVPEIREIDKKTASIGGDTLKILLSNPNKTEARTEMKNKFKVLRQRKAELMEKNNIPSDFDKIKYKCPLCEDTGYIEGKGRCSCFKQKIIDSLYKRSNMQELLKHQNFESFKTEFYSKNKVEGFQRTPYENILNIKKFCLRFVDDFDVTEKSLLLYGDTGLGKTFMSSSIAKALMEKGKTVLYIRAARLFRICEDERFGRKNDMFDEISRSDLLIIDDLGTEAFSKNNDSYLLDVVNDRLTSNKKIIINTNLNFENLEKEYSKRFTSRILDNFTMLFFYGEDIRKQKLFNNK